MMLLSPTVSFVLYHCTFFMYVCFYGSLCFRTTVRFYASTRLLYADCQFCFIPLYVSTYYVRFYVLCTFLRITLLLHHCTILRIYDATVRRLSVLFYTTVRSTHLRCYCTRTAGFVLYHCMFLHTMYVSTDHFAFTPLYDSTHL